MQIDQALRAVSGGLLLEGCPADDPDSTAALYCGVYRPLAAGDPAAPGTVAYRTEVIREHDDLGTPPDQ